MLFRSVLVFLTIVIILIVTYAQFREGVFSAFVMLVNVMIAGVVAFNFFEPLADLLEPIFPAYADPTRTTPPPLLWGYEDFFSMFLIFAVTLGILRALSNNLCNSEVVFPGMINQLGAAAIGMITGYLLSGFLVCLVQTLPLHEHVLGFEPRGNNESEFRGLFPADRVWLALMREAGVRGLARAADQDNGPTRYDEYPTFDRSGTFELRYLRYRRYDDSGMPPRNPLIYQGELGGAGAGAK